VTSTKTNDMAADTGRQQTLLQQKIEKLQQQVLLGTAPKGVALASGEDMLLSAQENMTLVAGKQLDIGAQKNFTLAVGKQISLWSQQGAKWFASQGCEVVCLAGRYGYSGAGGKYHHLVNAGHAYYEW